MSNITVSQVSIPIAIAFALTGCFPFQAPATHLEAASPPSTTPASSLQSSHSAQSPTVSSTPSDPELVRQAIITDPLINTKLQRQRELAEITTSATPIQVSAVAIRDNYALAEWLSGVGDLPLEGHALLVYQSGRWVVVDEIVGNTLLGASTTTLSALEVPANLIPSLLNDFRAAGATLDAGEVHQNSAPLPCVTVTNDSNPPTNVRFTPDVGSDNIAGQLPNGTTVTVMGTLNGWVKIRTPLVGWVALDLTRVSCGDTLQTVQQNFDRLHRLFEEANDSLGATDMLIRYMLNADGAAAEIAAGTFGQLAQNMPYMLVEELDWQTEEVRRSVLQMARDLMSPQAQAQFEEYLTSQHNSPTLETWKRLSQE